jgi:hypothetical protein
MFRDETFETLPCSLRPKKWPGCWGAAIGMGLAMGFARQRRELADKNPRAEKASHPCVIYWSPTMKSFIPSAFLPFIFGLAMVAGTAHAHQDHLKPMYGGVTADAEVFQVELVFKGAKATLHVTEHGSPVETANAKGKLTLLSGKNREEAELSPNGYQSMGAKLKARPAPGTKAVAVIDVPGKGVGTVRFLVK